MLYKLIVLYMLSRVAFPLTKAQISDFILGHGYTDFLTLQQILAELEEANMIDNKIRGNRTHMFLTEEGKKTLQYFENRIGNEIRDEITLYLKENEIQLRNEVSIQGTYYRTTGNEYMADLVARERDTELLHIQISVPLEEMAVSICDKWMEKNQQIYQYLTKELF